MASSPKINYPRAFNYIAKFSHSNEVMMLLLGYNVDNRFQFINLKTGCIMNLSFDSVEDAETWLYTMSEVIEKDAICPMYVP